MGFAVLHTEKGTGGSGGIGQHIDRDPNAKHTHQHADQNRAHLNQDFTPESFKKLSLPEAISKRIDEGYNKKRKIRKDAVRFATHILTGSHEAMNGIFADKETAQKWIQANWDFIAREFGADNIVRFSLHMDEKTPHLHVVTVPLTSDGRLSAKEVLGNPKAFENRQTDYANAMAEFGLKRGLKRKGIKHEDAKDYYARVNKAINSENLTAEVGTNVFGISTKEKYKEALKTAQMALDEMKAKLRTERAIKSVTAKQQQEFMKQLQEVRTLAFNPEKLKEFKNAETHRAWDNIVNAIFESRTRVDVSKVDDLIRSEMLKINPENNPWSTFRNSYGDQAEYRLHLAMQQQNEQLQKKEQKTDRNPRQNRGRGI